MTNVRYATEMAKLIADARGSFAGIVGSRTCSGGSIHEARLLELADGSQLFVKLGRAAGDMFAQEATGLSALAAVGILRTPQVITLGSLPDNWSCLVLEWIETSSAPVKCWERFGSELAELHRRGTGHGFGWASDNYIGSSPQKNETRESWTEFFRDCRLGFQLKMVRQAGLGSVELFRCAQRLCDRLGDWIAQPELPPSLLHGDLWIGNVLFGVDDAPVLIDPAVYYGSAEAELAMPLLFGGFPKSFFDAYHEAWPREDGWRDRVQIYQLYHLLNHLNLFGSGYLDSCLEIVRRFGS